ncbi:DUF5753 domain-containing protein [Streptomyces sp. TR02-1]|uniref:DUF5753 domain-containing protein n=1 Tax=Streptomyces sp. TR02-1 TaxID=3385977 RepID=UPI00399F6532
MTVREHDVPGIMERCRSLETNGKNGGTANGEPPAPPNEPAEVPEGVRLYSDLFSASHRVQMYTGNLVPGVLQTVEYACALLTALTPSVMPHMTQDQAYYRVNQGRELRSDYRRGVRMVLNESVLHQQMGAPVNVLSGQLEYLVTAISGNPQWSVQLLPSSSPLNAMQQFTTFHLVGGQTVVHAEPFGECAFSNDPPLLARRLDAFERLQAAALGPAESMERIIQRLRETWCVR